MQSNDTPPNMVVSPEAVAEEAKQEEIPLQFRLALPGDVALIYHSWLESYRSSLANHGAKTATYRRNQKKVIDDILTRPNVRVLVASNPLEERQVFGYMVVEARISSLVFHWVYVKKLFRKMGIARRLYNVVITFSDNNAELKASHIPHPGSGFFEAISNKIPITYDPSTQD